MNIPEYFLENRRLIGVGESTHGTQEFFENKVNLFKQLVEKHGFMCLLLEDQPAACQRVQQAIESGGSLPEAMQDLYEVWRTQELEKLFIWIQGSYRQRPIKVIGFDIDQTVIDPPRDKQMATNVQKLLPEGEKAMVWAHNFHIQFSAQNEAIPMGYFLKQIYGQQYAAVAQYCGSGAISATIIDPADRDGTSRTLSTIPLRAAPDDFLESRLSLLAGGSSYFLNLSAASSSDISGIDAALPARSIG